MSFFEALYRLILGPLELLFDVIYAITYQGLKNPGLSIVFLSLAINVLLLPLYKRADAIQDEEREKSILLKPRVDRIRKAFQGDERYMILQTYYRQNHYQPYYALRGALPLMLEIPFFITAYRFLSGLEALNGSAFGPIRDLGAPDGMLKIAGYSFHLLPILMTGINLLSSKVYTRGSQTKEKIQLYAMAAVFLVLLYHSPSGLVLYWTLNNFFSLIKNTLRRFPLPKILPRRSRAANSESKAGASGTVFFTCCIMMTVLMGILIPSTVINASPAEFVDLNAYQSPLRYLLSSFLLAAGTFLIWCGVYYGLSAPAGRRKISGGAAVITAVAIIDYMFFGKSYGNMSSLFKYDIDIVRNNEEALLNIAVILAAVVLIAVLYRKKPTLLQAFCIAGCIAVAFMSASKVLSICRQEKDLEEQASRPLTDRLTIPLDRSGKNVVVLMLDRYISGYIPFLMQEKPELQEQFAGFTYYPNTIAYGAYTNVGTPALFGGYDYIPKKMNTRTDTLLKDKQNEALKIMPLNFLENGFETTVCDAPYANYAWNPDMSIYDEWPEIHKYSACGMFTEKTPVQREYEEHVRNRNFFCYSVFRAAPTFLQTRLYNNALYNETKAIHESFVHRSSNMTVQTLNSISTAWGYDKMYQDWADVLSNLSNVTEIRDTGRGTFLMMSSKATHEAVLLQEPEYEQALQVDNTAYDAAHPIRYSTDGRELRLKTDYQMIHYHTDMVTLLQLGRWFDTLREQGVYDNTRIILVSDHGRNLGLFNMQLPNTEQECANIMHYIALLMVKDFGSNEFRTDNTFMTNADTPTLAFNGLIPDPQNPFLNRPVTDEEKEKPEQNILYTELNININNGTVFQGAGDFRNIWLTLKGKDLFDLSNWTVEPE